MIRIAKGLTESITMRRNFCNDPIVSGVSDSGRELRRPKGSMEKTRLRETTSGYDITITGTL